MIARHAQRRSIERTGGMRLNYARVHIEYIRVVVVVVFCSSSHNAVFTLITWAEFSWVEVKKLAIYITCRDRTLFSAPNCKNKINKIETNSASTVEFFLFFGKVDKKQPPIRGSRSNNWFAPWIDLLFRHWKHLRQERLENMYLHITLLVKHKEHIIRISLLISELFFFIYL